MCGIAGVYDFSGNAATVADVAQQMIDTLRHRGPDGGGLWADSDDGIALAQRRLAIVDLSENGAQPMHSRSGRYVIVYNGEIYNSQVLRQEIDRNCPGGVWRGHSDTEVFLGALEEWGLAGALKKVVGMFAFVLWDKQEKAFILGRDRLGEKPLYYGVIGQRLYFASELKAIIKVARRRLSINAAAVASFLRFGYIRGTTTIFNEIGKVRPGTSVSFGRSHYGHGQVSEYWAITSDSLREQQARLAPLSDVELVDQLEDKLQRAVAGQIVADVPVGAFLSGGIDSSTVVSLMQKVSGTRVQTFTIGTEDATMDEAPHARRIAQHLGTDHTELYVTSRDAMEVIPKIPMMFDEPFGDSSQIPTLLVAEMTRRKVTVSLSGDGGDELFSGYPRYQLTELLWRRVNRLPAPVRGGIAWGGSLLTPKAWDFVLGLALSEAKRKEVNGRRIRRASNSISARSLGDMYDRLTSQIYLEDGLLNFKDDEHSFADELDGWSVNQYLRHRDLVQYLPNDLLVKVDRATMFASLESRSPMLDHRVVEFAFALPGHVLQRDGTSKWLLRQVLHRYVPEELFNRRKAGFSVPLAEWLRGPLRQWASDILHSDAIECGGLVSRMTAESMWKEHLSGDVDHSYGIWHLLLLAQWYTSVWGTPQ